MEPTSKGDYRLDVPWTDVARTKMGIKEKRAQALLGVGEEVGRAALFGSASRFQGRDVIGVKMNPTTMVPYDQGKANVDWDRTERINRVQTQELDPAELAGLKASQPGLQHGALRHYLSQRQFGGSGENSGQFDTGGGEGNKTPVVFHNEDTGEKTLLSGHHRNTAAVISNSPILARVVRGYTKMPQGRPPR